LPLMSVVDICHPTILSKFPDPTAVIDCLSSGGWFCYAYARGLGQTLQNLAS